MSSGKSVNSASESAELMLFCSSAMATQLPILLLSHLSLLPLFEKLDFGHEENVSIAPDSRHYPRRVYSGPAPTDTEARKS